MVRISLPLEDLSKRFSFYMDVRKYGDLTEAKFSMDADLDQAIAYLIWRDELRLLS